ncbi:hypothetical protein C8R46DRAFT_255815 [Mycena filopes]|nr:hypothetical protein C8R46DRAFT_255815 [Mycena filopes]
MDSLQFDDNNAPRTPSPPAPMPTHRYSPHQNYKPDLDPVRIFSQDDDHYHWAASNPSQAHARPPSLLQELYDGENNNSSLSPEQHPSPPDMYALDGPAGQDAWPQPQVQQQQQGRPHDYTLIRRATFPYARQERPDELAAYPPFLHATQSSHNNSYDMPLSAEPSALHGHGHHHGDGGYSPPGYGHGGEYEGGGGVKVEQEHHHLPHYAHQQQQQFYRPMQHQQQQQQHHYGPHPHQLASPPMMHPSHPSHPSHPHPHSAHPHPHAPHPYHTVNGAGGFAPHGLPVQHTDDAASKETQYLRRRCYNCHTTEPPSWRRSTLNPGKIVCNKCGLYERTHLRARPLRFDELRAGNKARKGGKSPKAGANGKKGGVGGGGAGARRSSVSSTGSGTGSAQSGGSGASDWDDNVSVYSTPSAPPTSFNSPAFSPHPPSLALSHSLSSSSLSSHNSHSHSHGSRDSLSRSPPLMGSPHLLGSPPPLGSPNPSLNSPHMGGVNGGNGIRIPHAPDIPTLHGSHSPYMGAGGVGMGAMGRDRGTKPRSNTTGHPSASQSYYGGGGGGQLHHSSSNSSLHSQHSAHSSHGSPLMHPSSALANGQEGGDGAGLYRRGSMPDMHAGLGLGLLGGGNVGGAGWEDLGMGVKEEPRAVVV